MVRTTISWTVVVSGIILGVAFLLFVAPVALFTLGVNDSAPDIVGMAALLCSVLPASVLAIYKRREAGVWLTSVGFLSASTTIWNEYRVLTTRAIHFTLSELIGSGSLGMLAMILGLFFWITAATGWPNLRLWKGAGVW
jgi:hypothetical protein